MSQYTNWEELAHKFRREHDDARRWADSLAGCLARHLGVDLSAPSGVDRWAEARDLIGHAAPPAHASDECERLHDAVRAAYGWLWLAISSDERIHRARAILHAQLGHEDIRRGIQLAMAAGGTVDGAALEAALSRGME